MIDYECVEFHRKAVRLKMQKTETEKMYLRLHPNDSIHSAPHARTPQRVTRRAVHRRRRDRTRRVWRKEIVEQQVGGLVSIVVRVVVIGTITRVMRDGDGDFVGRDGGNMSIVDVNP